MKIARPRVTGADALPARLIRAGLHHFGRSGYAGASTRAISESAGTTMSCLSYHFASKLGLYVAVRRHGEDILVSVLNDHLADRNVNASCVTRQQMSNATDALVDCLFEPDKEDLARFCAREAMPETSVFGNTVPLLLAFRLLEALRATWKPCVSSTPIEVMMIVTQILSATASASLAFEIESELGREERTSIVSATIKRAAAIALGRLFMAEVVTPELASQMLDCGSEPMSARASRMSAGAQSVTLSGQRLSADEMRPEAFELKVAD